MNFSEGLHSSEVKSHLQRSGSALFECTRRVVRHGCSIGSQSRIVFVERILAALGSNVEALELRPKTTRSHQSTMASKFKRQQRRKRWSDVGITFTADFAARVHELGVARISCESCSDVSFHFKRLQQSFLQFMQLHSTYAESAHLKNLVCCFEATLQCCLGCLIGHLEPQRQSNCTSPSAMAPSLLQSLRTETWEPGHRPEPACTMTASSDNATDRDCAAPLVSGVVQCSAEQLACLLPFQ